MIVPYHQGRDLAIGTLRNIMITALIPEEEWKSKLVQGDWSSAPPEAEGGVEESFTLSALHLREGGGEAYLELQINNVYLFYDD